MIRKRMAVEKKTPFFKERVDQRRPWPGFKVGGQSTAWCYPPSTHLDSCEHSFQKDGAKGLSLKKETKKTLLAANDSYARRNATYPTFSVTPPSNKTSHFLVPRWWMEDLHGPKPFAATNHSLFYKKLGKNNWLSLKKAQPKNTRFCAASQFSKLSSF